MDRNLGPFNEMLRELDDLKREVHRVFHASGLDRLTRPFTRMAFLPGLQSRTYPLMNMSEDTEAVYVEALAPGVDPETLSVSVLKDQLTVSGEKPESKTGLAPENYHRNERAAGRFVRTLHLPTEVEDAQVTAEYKNGLLLITLPKAEQLRPKQITIKTE